MPRRPSNLGRFGLSPHTVVLVLASVACGASVAHAQELGIKREYPGSRPFACPAVPATGAVGGEERAQARQLASTAAQAVILGDLGRARTLLDRAVELDPTSSDLAYRRARVLEDLGEREAAVAGFCRVVALDPASESAGDAQARLDSFEAAQRAAVPPSAVEAFRQGLDRVDAGQLEGAEASFGAAVTIAPDWPEAVYDRGVVRSRLGRTTDAIQDLRRYLELRPDAPDANAVSERIGELQSVTLVSRPSPGAALALGVLLPGMGQFYSGRAGPGLAVLSLAGGAVAAGFLIKEVDVRCLAVVEPGQDCPAGQVLREDVTRPYRTAGLGAAAAVAVVGAIEAAVKARGRGAAPSPGAPAERAAAAPRLQPPTVSVHGPHVHLALVRISFR